MNDVELLNCGIVELSDSFTILQFSNFTIEQSFLSGNFSIQQFNSLTVLLSGSSTVLQFNNSTFHIILIK
jgi:hypothetical protein